MKPIGRERNKEIAEAKGLKGYDCIRHSFKDLICVFCGCSYKESAFRKRWSTSIPAAWELWEELPLPKKYIHVGGKHEIGVQNNYAFSRDYTIGESFPDAVTQAWLTWKKGEK